MAKAKKLPSGNWRIRIGAGEAGKTKSFTAPTKKEAEIMAAEYLSGIRRPISEENLFDAVEKYISERSNILSPSTLQGYRKIQNNYLGSLAYVRLCDLSNHDLANHVNALSKQYSPKTVYNAHGLISAVIKEYCPELNTSVKLPQKQREIKQFPRPEEIITAFRNSDIELPVLLALWLGLRMSEIRGARKSDVTDGILTIRRTLLDVDGEHIVRENTKTYYSTRSIRLPSYILALIEQQPSEEFTTMTHSMIYKRFVATLEVNGLPRIRFHDLRHLNASLMLSLGIPDKYAMERGGWSNTQVMRGVYQHTFDDDRRKVDDIIDQYFESLF